MLQKCKYTQFPTRQSKKSQPLWSSRASKTGWQLTHHSDRLVGDGQNMDLNLRISPQSCKRNVSLQDRIVGESTQYLSECSGDVLLLDGIWISNCSRLAWVWCSKFVQVLDKTLYTIPTWQAYPNITEWSNCTAWFEIQLATWIFLSYKLEETFDLHLATGLGWDARPMWVFGLSGRVGRGRWSHPRRPNSNSDEWDSECVFAQEIDFQFCNRFREINPLVTRYIGWQATETITSPCVQEMEHRQVPMTFGSSDNTREVWT